MNRCCFLWGVGCILLVVIVLLAWPVGLILQREYTIRTYMSPYYRFVRQHATEAQIISKEGPPVEVMKTDRELAVAAKRFHPFKPWFMQAVPMRVEGKVLGYYADPWHDGEGYLVYLFINRKGVLTAAVLGG